MNTEALLYANTSASSDMLYFAGVQVPDEFFAFTHKSKRCAILSPLEIGRCAKFFDEVFDIYSITGNSSDYFFDIAKFLKAKKIKNFLIPKDFPVYVYDKLKNYGINLSICETEIFPNRHIKSLKEQKEIIKANSVSTKAYEMLVEILGESKIKNGLLYWNKEILTSEILHKKVRLLAFENGASSEGTIIASGKQACDPHQVGSGAIRANEFIVADIFPRMQNSGYYGDMTRTFLKGKPNKRQIDLYNTVKNAQSLAIDQLKEGVNSAHIHSSVCDFFEAHNYETKQVRGKWEGFFHSTGHSLGLDIHETLSIGRKDCILTSGNVLTVEPGLYYRNIGGCRIEDVLLIQKNGAKRLSNFNYEWIID